ncbi:MAG: 4-alpha-glucanotransferase, partial [Flavisolibacter sp.]|nr:4-alpha-glucanotransferase [Flavisolibacter sp.]
MKIDFYLRFHTKFGQSLAITGNLPVLGEDEPDKALPMSFLSDELWQVSIEIDPSETETLRYRYIFIDEKGVWEKEAEKERIVEIKKAKHDLLFVDTWNDPSLFENSFYSAPFKEVFFRDRKKLKLKKNNFYTHQFKIKAPLVSPDETVCLLGSSETLGYWNTDTPILLSKKGNWWTVHLEIPASEFAMSYKYGVYNLKTGSFVRFENGDNRILHNDGSVNKKTIIHDGFLRLPVNQWKGTGLAIPVFSLRSNNSFGIGEFNDIKLLVDWADEVGMKMIQLLPINDTSATNTWKDSYPYAAISAFALHPIYINLQKVAGKKGEPIIKTLNKKQKQLNGLAEIDYEQVIHFKINVLHELFDLDNLDFL